MVKEDYVSFEIAKLLKEKGFNVETEHDIWYVVEKFSTRCDWDSCTYKVGDITREYDEKCCIVMPTLQMAMKWLREEHNMHIAINICYTENPELFQPDYYVYVHSTVTGESLIKETCPLVQDNSLTPKGFTSYEEACEAAIKYCLEKLI